MTSAGAHDAMKKLAAGIRRLGKDRRGVAAVEFALIVPILLILYFLTMEASQGIETSKKVSRANATVADLVAQQSTVDPDSLKAILEIADTTLRPYYRSEPDIVITAIEVVGKDNPKAQVAWEYKVVGDSYGPGAVAGSATTLPNELTTEGAFLVRVTSTLAYVPVIAWSDDAVKTTGIASIFSHITMGETNYVRPRMTTTISCPNCYTK